MCFLVLLKSRSQPRQRRLSAPGLLYMSLDRRAVRINGHINGAGGLAIDVASANWAQLRHPEVICACLSSWYHVGSQGPPRYTCIVHGRSALWDRAHTTDTAGYRLPSYTCVLVGLV